MKFLSIAMISLLLSACASSNLEETCTIENCAAQNQVEPKTAEAPELETGETKVPGIFVGMTRDEVIGVLGTNFSSFVGLERPPFVDSFPYTEDGVTKFIYVRYRSGVVRAATSGHADVYIVY
ncbi:MAG: hypothetical protein ACWA40_05505 [Planktomarina sp.]